MTDWQTLIGYDFSTDQMYFQGREWPDAPPGELPHIKAFIRHSDGGDGSIGGATGNSRYFREAILMVQCFGPIARGDGLEVSVQIATILQRAFEGYKSPGCVWFRRCRIQEEDPSGNWDQCNMYCTLTYDEVH